jgi:hypothetical protein
MVNTLRLCSPGSPYCQSFSTRPPCSIVFAMMSKLPFERLTDRASAQLCWPLEMGITSRFINKIICHRRVPPLIRHMCQRCQEPLHAVKTHRSKKDCEKTEKSRKGRHQTLAHQPVQNLCLENAEIKAKVRAYFQQPLFYGARHGGGRETRPDHQLNALIRRGLLRGRHKGRGEEILSQGPVFCILDQTDDFINQLRFPGRRFNLKSFSTFGNNLG